MGLKLLAQLNDEESEELHQIALLDRQQMQDSSSSLSEDESDDDTKVFKLKYAIRQRKKFARDQKRNKEKFD